jgi:hypothetical protein
MMSMTVRVKVDLNALAKVIAALALLLTHI